MCFLIMTSFKARTFHFARIFFGVLLSVYILSTLMAANFTSIHHQLFTKSLRSERVGVRNYGAYSTVSSPADNQAKDCSVCYPYNFSIINGNNNICSTANQIDMQVEVIILIRSAHDRKKQRDTLRKTWLTYAKRNTGRVRYAFLVGVSKNTSEDRNFQNEILTHNDIIQGNFQDLYETNTLKAITAFKWATKNCEDAEYFMKVNDDVFINIPALLSILHKRPGLVMKTSISGNCKIGTQTDSLYQFCSSDAYILGMNVARNVQRKFAQQPFDASEETFLAKCLKKLGYGFSALPGFKVNVKTEGVKLCKFKQDNYISASGLSPEVISQIWTSNCNGEFF